MIETTTFFVCWHCGLKFKVHRRGKYTTAVKYCSRQCVGAARSKEFDRNRTNVNCRTCGKEMSVGITKRNPEHCSVVCAKKDNASPELVLAAHRFYNASLEREKRRLGMSSDERSYPHTRRRYAIRKQYGITYPQYEAMIEKCNRACEACGHAVALNKSEMTDSTRLAHLDHNHVTMAVRGILCSNCNSALGYAKDSPDMLRKIADYIERNKHVDWRACVIERKLHHTQNIRPRQRYVIDVDAL